MKKILSKIGKHKAQLIQLFGDRFTKYLEL